MSLDQLIIQCEKQNVKAQESLYRYYANMLFSICLKYSSNRTEAEDSLQDAFITIFKNIGQYKSTGSFEGWLKRIAINTVLQKHRKHRVFEIVNEDILETPDIEIEEDEVPLDFLLKIIQDLPHRYRLVFNLYVLDSYSHSEIAKLLNISVGTSKSNLARARLILKNKVQEKNALDHVKSN